MKRWKHGAAGFAIALLCVAFSAETSTAQVREEAIVTSATNVLTDFIKIPNHSIPKSLLKRAQGLVIIPHMLKVGFVAGARRGKGIVVIRDQNGAWKPPLFVTMTGGSFGWQAGIQSTDVILVFMTQNSIRGLLSGKFTLGVDAAAAAGPIGRQATAATDGRLQAEILSYSRSRGLFAGVAIDGSVLQIDAASNQLYYRAAGMTPDGVAISPNAQLPPSAARLLAQLASYTSSAAPVTNQAVPAATTNNQILPQNPQLASGISTAVPAVATPPQHNTPGSGLQPHNSVPPTSAAPPTSSGINLGPPPVDSPQDIDTTRQSLVAAAKKLGALLNDSWRMYLALPQQVFSGGAPPPLNKLDVVIERFDRVTKDPRYRQLTQRQEFKQLYELLQVYRQQLRLNANRTAH